MHMAEAALYLLEAATAIGILLAVGRPRGLDVGWSALLVGSAVFWLVRDTPIEGHILWVVSASHGITTGDLAAVPALALVLALTGRHVTGGHRRVQLEPYAYRR